MNGQKVHGKLWTYNTSYNEILEEIIMDLTPCTNSIEPLDILIMYRINGTKIVKWLWSLVIWPNAFKSKIQGEERNYTSGKKNVSCVGGGTCN